MKRSRFNSDDMRGYLLGSAYQGPGLLKKVEERVTEQDEIDGPSFQTGSVMRTGFTHTSKDHGEETGYSETTFGLYVGLVQWLGEGIGWDKSGRTERDLLKYLVSNRITDVQALTLGGHFARVRAEVDRILPKEREFTPEDAVWQRADSLIRFLVGWLETNCDHNWERIADIDTSMRVAIYRCSAPHCECQKFLYEDDPEQWIAV